MEDLTILLTYIHLSFFVRFGFEVCYTTLLELYSISSVISQGWKMLFDCSVLWFLYWWKLLNESFILLLLNSESTKQPLLACASVHLKHKFLKYTNEISSLSQRVLLSGPPGLHFFSLFFSVYITCFGCPINTSAILPTCG